MVSLSPECVDLDTLDKFHLAMTAMNKFLTLMAGLLLALPATAREPRALTAAAVRSGAIVVPMVIRSGFPFVRGEVNGLAGYFMLDTGTPFVAFLNNPYLRLPPGQKISSGAASSGQKIVVSRNACLRSLRIANRYTLDTNCGLPGTDLAFVAAELKLPLLGFLGADLFKRFRITFDWTGHRVMLTDRIRPPEAGALTTFRFKAEDRQVPGVTVTAGKIQIGGAMDTGNPGEITLTRTDADRLLADGALVAIRDKHGSPRYVLAHVGHEEVELNTGDLPVTIGGDRSRIMLGFLFLNHYRSTWDYTDRSVRLYRSSTIQR